MATRPAEAHQAGQEALASLIPALLRQSWPLLDVHDLAGSLPKFMTAVRAIVRRYGQASAVSALAYYRAERRAAGVPGRPVLRIAPTPADKVIESAVGWAVSDLYGPVTTESTVQALDRLDESVSRLVLNQGRDTIIDATRSDKAAKGWARVVEGDGKACSFCLMLALRAGAGFLYTSKLSASFHPHNGCRCVPEPVWTAYEPPAALRDAQALWKTSTKGRSGHDARIAFRQAVEGRPVTGVTKVKRG